MGALVTGGIGDKQKLHERVCRMLIPVCKYSYPSFANIIDTLSGRTKWLKRKL
jgi:hypothetical protein